MGRGPRRVVQACCVLLAFVAVALGTQPGGPSRATSPTRAGHADEHWQAKRRSSGRPPPHQMCQLTLQRERAEAALGREKTGQKNGSVLGTALSWVIPPTTVYLSPSVTAGLAALPAVLMVYLLWTIHSGNSSGKALCQCWLVVVVISLLLRWHVVTIVIEHLGASVSITIWQWFSTPDTISSQLAQALTLGTAETMMAQMGTGQAERPQQQAPHQLRLYDSSHSAALPLTYLVAAEFVPQLQSAPGSPDRRFKLIYASTKPVGACHSDAAPSTAGCLSASELAGDSSVPPPERLVSFEDATLMDAKEVKRAAAAIAASAAAFSSNMDARTPSSSSLLPSFADGAAVAATFGQQLATQGFVRLKVKSAGGLPAAAAAQAAAASVFHRTRLEKLALSNRLWEPEPAGRCVCTGYCAQDCARE
jgi:hypothetical protein